MDDIADSLIKRFISKLKVAITEVFESFNIELALPLILNSEQCKKLLGVSNYDRFQEIISIPGFPKIDKGKGSHVRFPRDAIVEWMKENWELL